MKTLLETGQKIYIDYKDKITRYIYSGYNQKTGFHRLDCFSKTLFLTTPNLERFMIEDYKPSSFLEKFNDVLDFLSFDVDKRVAV